ncbi:hypothetical protein ABBQ32_003818 [Trebouxia sp. C0010 RCD-2024]
MRSCCSASDMDYSDDNDDSESEYGTQTYPFHDACESLDASTLQALLQVRSDTDLTPGLPNEKYDLDTRDRDGCTPLHVAILSGSLECLKTLLEAGAGVSRLCEGSPPLHIAVSVGALPEQQAFSAAAVDLLLQHGAVPYERDDHGRTALHWAAAHGLTSAASALLLSSSKMQATQKEQEADGANNEMPSLDLLQDKQGNTALHLAASCRQRSMVDLLLSYPSDPALPSHEHALATSANRAGLLPIHAAAIAGCSACCSLCYSAASGSGGEDILAVKDKKGLTAAEWAHKHGHQALAKQLADARSRAQAISGAEPSGDMVPDQASLHSGEDGMKPTLLVAPAECYSHRTCPEPITRDGQEPPPENVNRLKVLTHPASGILRSAEFSNLQWDERSQPGCMADILRVHDWSYVRSIQHLCASIPDVPSVVGHLDADTAISHGTFRAAQVAAGGICRAVDQVVSGQVRNAFCAIRPPGHHAGPTGVVGCANDPAGSHGFCLLNNLAIAAAYAMNAHRHAGIRRVALLDFDVHHGNGTEACVRETAPSLRKFSFKTPFSEGSQTFPVYSPWLDTDDADNILFASVQGYGQKAPGIGAFVYPGSGATCDTRPASAGATAPPGVAQPNDLPSTEQEEIVEDPDNEFDTDVDSKHGDGPRVINVGIPGPGAHVPLWKRAWRDKILPAVARFKPDIIFISAGFDAHRKDDINFRYIGIQEKEFEWLTEQLVSLANKYCKGRIVSALEGGYRIQGGIVSAFARSVASHVRALSAPTHAQWSWADVQAEQRRERQRKAQLAEQERQRHQAKLAVLQARLAEATSQPEANTAADDKPQQAALHSTQLSSSQPVEHMETEQQMMSQVAGTGGHTESGRKRRRTVVDYVALNKQLEAEAARSASVQSVLQHPSSSQANAPLTFVTNAPSAVVGVHATDGVPNQRPDSASDNTALNVRQVHAAAADP